MFLGKRWGKGWRQEKRQKKEKKKEKCPQKGVFEAQSSYAYPCKKLGHPIGKGGGRIQNCRGERQRKGKNKRGLV